MNNTTRSFPPRARALRLWSAARNELSERRQERTQYRVLQRELATYTTRADVDDLLATIEGEQGAEVDMIRNILANNLIPPRTHALAS